jgi:hypothetical protein
VTGGVANRKKDRCVSLCGEFESVFVPGLPGDRVVGVLAEVQRGCLVQAVFHTVLRGSRIVKSVEEVTSVGRSERRRR